MGLDIRIPLGLIFLFIGGLMSLYGFITRNAADVYEKSMGINLNQDDPVNPRPWEKDARFHH